jgi:hypothetical protein
VSYCAKSAGYEIISSQGDSIMSSSVEQILNSFDRLPDSEKRQVMSEILRRTMQMDFPSLTDDELVLNAEALFLELDQRESGDE